MPTRTEIHELEVQKAAERGVREALESMEIRAASQGGSLLGEVLSGGTYESDGDYVQYEVSGDICAVYPVGP